MGKATYSVTLATNTLDVTRDPVASNIKDSIAKLKITHVGGVYNAKPASATQEEWAYPYAVMTILHVERQGGEPLKIELQDVSNQATWSTGQQTGLQQAITDINAWL
jgi:hypothetical protein